MSYEKSEPGRVAPVIPGRHGPALRRKSDIYYLTLNSPVACDRCKKNGILQAQVPGLNLNDELQT